MKTVYTSTPMQGDSPLHQMEEDELGQTDRQQSPSMGLTRSQTLAPGCCVDRGDDFAACIKNDGACATPLVRNF
jgi:hypothetical protein